jgi:hypothetical protein
VQLSLIRRDFPDHNCRIASHYCPWPHILGNDRSGSNNRTLPDVHALQHNCVHANPRFIPDSDRPNYDV